MLTHLIDLKMMASDSILDILARAFAVNDCTGLPFLIVFLKRSNSPVCVQSLSTTSNFSRQDFLISFPDYLSRKPSVGSFLHTHRCIFLFRSKNQLSSNNVSIVYHHTMYPTASCSRGNQATIRRGRGCHAPSELFVF